jgi:hypothetical protein
MTQRMGSTMAAAVTGETVRVIAGTARMPTPDPKPPLDMPVMSSAGIATA